MKEYIKKEGDFTGVVSEISNCFLCRRKVNLKIPTFFTISPEIGEWEAKDYLMALLPINWEIIRMKDEEYPVNNKHICVYICPICNKTNKDNLKKKINAKVKLEEINQKIKYYTSQLKEANCQIEFLEKQKRNGKRLA